ncbi:MAG: hybrid sensor histidine kinase/response regulator [Polyangiaceae bacterium]|nr:hybrid sensor histidine kinase/response regulator [Polyangiaceae bacterium]
MVRAARPPEPSRRRARGPVRRGAEAREPAPRAELEVDVERALGAALLGLGELLHDLGTATGALGANLEYATSADPGDPEREGALADAYRAGLELQSLVAREVAALRAGSEPRASTYRVDELVGEVARARAPVRLERAATLPPCVAEGDPEHLRAVLAHLVRSAARAGAGRVRLGLEASPTELVLELADDGRALTDEERARAFEPRGAGERAGRDGLSLYLVARQLRLMGGSIEAASAGKRGVVLTLRLPGRRVARAASTATARADASARRVLLVVDDAPAMARGIARCLRRSFDVVHVAHDLASAGRLLADPACPPTHVVCDQHLGDGDELGAAAIARWRHAHPALVRAVLLTGSDTDGLHDLPGIDHVLSKPVDPALLRELLAPPGGAPRSARPPTA